MCASVEKAAGGFFADKSASLLVSLADRVTLIFPRYRSALLRPTLPAHQLRYVLEADAKSLCQNVHRVATARISKANLRDLIIREFGGRVPLAMLVQQAGAVSVFRLV